jgi:hypothetical protein
MRVALFILMFISFGCTRGTYTYSNFKDLSAGSNFTVKSNRKDPVKITVTNNGADAIISVVHGSEEKIIRQGESTSFTGDLRSHKIIITNNSKVTARANIVIENVKGKIILN